MRGGITDFASDMKQWKVTAIGFNDEAGKVKPSVGEF